MPRLITFLLGFGIGLAGDACHVVSGTTVYSSGIPTIWKSEIWFPFVVGFAVLAAAEVGRRAGLPRRPRGVNDVIIGGAIVLALYALTAVLRGQPATVSVVLCAAIAVAVWAWWDPSPGAFGIAIAAAVLGPVAEMFVADYASDSDGLFGVAPWLPCLYFAAGAVASGLLKASDVPSTSADTVAAERE